MKHRAPLPHSSDLPSVIVDDVSQPGGSAIAGDRPVDETIRLVVEAMPNAVVLADAQGRIVLVNKAGEQLFGYSREELIGQPVEILVPPRYRAAHPHQRAVYTGQGGPRPIGNGLDLSALRKDGSEVPVEIGLNPIQTPGGALTLSVIIDITERKRAEEAVRASEEQMRLIVETALDAVVMMDSTGMITGWSAQAEATFGWTRHEAIGRLLSETIIPHCHREAHQRGMQRYLATGKAVVLDRRIEITALHRDGREFPVELAITPIRIGETITFSAFVRDISERKQAEDEIHRLNTELELRVIERTAQLEGANKELEAFSYSVSHDLRTPLRAIDGFSQAVLEDYSPLLPEEGQQRLRTIRRGAQKMGMLIDDLLTFSRLSRAPLDKRQIDTGELVRGVLGDLAAQQTGRQIDLRIGEMPGSVGDPALLRQVWINLLSNALKYTRRREMAVIEIGCLPEHGETVYFVRDNGAGFDMDHAAKLFGVFQRLHRAEEYEGTGVGLAIVQRIVHRHGGRIWAEAAVDLGATFYFTLEGENTKVIESPLIGSDPSSS